MNAQFVVLPKARNADDAKLVNIITHMAREAFEPSGYARVHKDHLPLALNEVFVRTEANGVSEHPELGKIVAIVQTELDGDYSDYERTSEALYGGLVKREQMIEGADNIVSL